MIKQNGFTLVEVMVAMAITAVVTVMAYYGIDSAIRLSQAAEVEADYLSQVNRAFDVMTRDMRQMIGRQVREPSGLNKESALILDKNNEEILRFSRVGWTNPEPVRFQRSQLQRVHYLYDGEKLIRRSWQMLDRYDDSKEQDVTLLEGVTALSIRVMQQPDISQLASGQLGANVFVNIASTKEEQWQENWPPANDSGLQQSTSALPMAIEITLTLKRWGEIKRIFEIVDSGGEEWIR